MAKSFTILLLLVISLHLYLLAAKEVYIVRLSGSTLFKAGKSNGNSKQEMISKHDQILSTLMSKQSRVGAPVKLYSYTSAINAFSAVLNEVQAKQILTHPDVASVTKDVKLKLHTTRTYSFLGLDIPKVGAWARSNASNIVIGMIDDGIWPEAPSFSAKGYGKVPTKFKGRCQTGKRFSKQNCNAKIVGARYFIQGLIQYYGYIPSGFQDYVSPRSGKGHGSHTSSIAGGSTVSNIKLGNTVLGSAKGVSFKSRIAMYKVCWADKGCFLSDIVAGIDQAVRDGVDVISVSLGYSNKQYSIDLVSLAALGAVQSGVPCVFSAGNDGDYGYGTVSNTSPWVLTVGASTLDRKFSNYVTLGSGITLKGRGFTSSTNGTFPLYEDSSSSLCYPGDLRESKAKGKIVLCTSSFVYSVAEQAKEVKRVKGVGMIHSSSSSSNLNIGGLAVSFLSYEDWYTVEKYYLKNKNARASITAKTLTGADDVEAPRVAEFSSRGPNFISNELLKPDIVAPGVDILGAWSNSSFASPPFIKSKILTYASGTSMSCPHVAGAVALLKSVHPLWPPSWLYSAIITTGSVINNRNTSILDETRFRATPFDMGGGHLNVNAALDPGLVFGVSSQEYENILCSAAGGYIEFLCEKKYREIDLNLPSLSLYNLMAATTVQRTVTLVGKPATYFASVKAPAGSEVVVNPAQLNFTKYGETKSFSIKVKPIKSYNDLVAEYPNGVFTFGTIVWSDGALAVKMNLAVNIP